MAEPTSRRAFLKQVGLASASLPLLRRGPRPTSPNEKLNIAGIGCGGKGWSDIRDVSKDQNVVALCDVDPGRLHRATEKYPGAKTYADWRRLLEQKDIDAVTISTPDHMHAAIAMAAMQLGKHVYCQKPLTHSVFEARQLTLQAERSGVVTQMGNQHRSGPQVRGARKLVRGGAIGQVREAHVWTDRPIWPQGMERPAGSDPVPDGLEWDLWLGVAPGRPFKQKVYHPFRWRGFWDFGTGALGDMGCHLLDPVLWGMDLPAPERVSAQGPPPHPDTAPGWSIVTYRFAATSTRPALEVTWYDGKKLPPRELLMWPAGRTLPKNGCLFVGEKGNLFCTTSDTLMLLFEDGHVDFDLPIVEADDHYMQWTNACKGEGETVSPFSSAGPMAETVLLGNVAYRLGGEIRWDAEGLRVPGRPEADALIRREYREGWEVDWVV